MLNWFRVVCVGYLPCIFRPPDILVGGLKFYRDSIFFFLYFRPLPSELPKRNSTKTGYMLRSKCDLKMHVRNLGFTLPIQIGSPNHFLTTSQFNGNVDGLYLGNENTIYVIVHVLDNSTKGLLHRVKMSRTLVHKRLQIRPPFYALYVNSAFYFIARLCFETM